MATINVKDAADATVALEKPLTPGRAAAASSRPTVMATEDLAATRRTSGTGTQSDVSGTASDTTILASNTARVGAVIYNDSAAILYLLFSNDTTTSSNFSVKMFADDYCAVPAGYTGVVKGIWSSATGAARVTEFVA